MLKRLNHRNVVKLVHEKRTENSLYLFLDYCNQGDLSSFIRQFNEQKLTSGDRYSSHESNRLSESDARYIFGQIAQGLAYLNEKAIVHRDIKLDNILVSREKRSQEPQIEDYVFKIGDMGFAKEMQSA